MLEHGTEQDEPSGSSVCFFPQPFRTIPTLRQWLDLIQRVLAVHDQHGVDLFVIDPLAPFLRGENQARSMLETLLPLAELTRAGMAGLLLHHPARGDRPLGQAARGSGALLGHVDVSIDMRHPGGDPLTRRRRLFSLSRHSATPRQMTMELDQAGTAYQLLPESAHDPVTDYWEPLRLVLSDAPQKLTRQDIHTEWPSDFDQPRETTLWRLLDRAVEQGLILCEGTGRKTDPFRYWLPEREGVWKQDPMWSLIEEQRQRLNLPFESLTERKEKLRQAGESHGSPAPPKATEIMRNLGLVPDPWQIEVLDSPHPRLLLNYSRQSGKFTVVAILALVEAVCTPCTKVLLLSRLGDSWFRQEYGCSFEALEGLVYPDFARCLLPGPAPLGRPTVSGIDFGFHNPFAAVWGTVKDGVLILTGEQYLREKPLSYHVQFLPRGVMWYADPSGANESAELTCAGFKMRETNNSLYPGIAAVTDRLQSSRLRVLEGACPNLLAEAGLYRYGNMQDQLYERLRQNTATAQPELEAFWQAAAQQNQEELDRLRKPIAQTIPEQFILLVMCQDEKHQLELLARFQSEGLECKVLLS